MSLIINFPLTIFFAILPSYVWLNFYLKRDVKPEPKSEILKVFCLGMLFSLPAFLLEKFFLDISFKLNLPLIFNIFISVAFVEEFLKFLVVKWGVFKSKELDEPVDIMIYIICAALGFAAAENLFLLMPFQELMFQELTKISFLRFIGATFLHALSSGILGFFIGLSFFNKKERLKLIFLGLILATLLHGFYNFFIIKFEGGKGILFSAILILCAAYFISFGFNFISGGFKRLKNNKVW